jgi:hypothetical protein
LEELYELLEALICCNRAGIQIKAGKLKFGVPKVVFHNYAISKGGTEPKEVNVPSETCKNQRTYTNYVRF